MKNILVFASGTENGGGSGFEKLVENSRNGILNGKIIAIISNHKNGGVFEKAKKLNIKFEYFSGPYEKSKYQKIVKKYQPDLICLSGWLKLVKGLDSKFTINIHPGLLPELGGSGMYGIHVHKKAIEEYQKGKIKNTAVSMHFVTEKYDKGPVFFSYPIKIFKDDTPEVLQNRVNKAEHKFQSKISDMVLQGKISWDGKNPSSLKLPKGYRYIRSR
jgi:phosphoribosylglycinamide formyltransferase-1